MTLSAVSWTLEAHDASAPGGEPAGVVPRLQRRPHPRGRRGTFALERGETMALVGESGCGKSLTSLALLRLIPRPGRIEPESVIRLGDSNVLALEGEALRHIRGRRIGMIFQDPMTSLNPVLTAGNPDRRGDSRALSGLARGGEGAIAAPASGSRDSGPRLETRCLSPPAQRRYAPTRDDRHRPRRRA